MTTFASPILFKISPIPLDHDLSSSRKMLLSNPGFLCFWGAIPHPAALLSSSHRLVMTNQQMNRWLGIDSDEDLVGAELANLDSRPDGPDPVHGDPWQRFFCKGFLS